MSDDYSDLARLLGITPEECARMMRQIERNNHGEAMESLSDPDIPDRVTRTVAACAEVSGVPLAAIKRIPGERDWYTAITLAPPGPLALELVARGVEAFAFAARAERIAILRIDAGDDDTPATPEPAGGAGIRRTHP